MKEFHLFYLLFVVSKIQEMMVRVCFRFYINFLDILFGVILFGGFYLYSTLDFLYKLVELIHKVHTLL